MKYVGRFAPSPTGPLHAGSMVAALASWLDARAAGGEWLVRIEDVDTLRAVHGAGERILGQLAACGLRADRPVVWQSQRDGLYQAALHRLIDSGAAYPCACSRRDVEKALAASGVTVHRDVERVYPGICRCGTDGRVGKAVRLLTVDPQGDDIQVAWNDRRLGKQVQNVTREVGDFVLKRADGPWAYQLAVVVDDADQGVTHVVRGEDLADNTPRQILLQHRLSLPSPIYLHAPLVMAPDGAKLSKQHGAPPVDGADPLGVLKAAGRVLGLGVDASEPGEWLREAIRRWRALHPSPGA